MTTLTCLWIQSELDDLSKECIKSWLKLGYHIDLYTYSKLFTNNISVSHLHIKDARKILDIDIENETNKPFLADKWRFHLFKKNQCEDKERIIWLDTDILLLKRIPNTKNFVSSQLTQQTGAFKCKHKVVPNIGVICMDGTENINYDKILKVKGKDTAYQSKYLKEWERQLKDTDLIIEPESFCPVHWAWAKDFYTEPFFKKQFKYGITQKQIEDFTNEDNIYGVHLWRQILKKKNFGITEDSVYKKLLTKI